MNLKRFYPVGLVCCFLGLFYIPAYALLSASIDRNNLPLGESFQLTVSSDTAHSNQPLDGSPLKKDFDILSTAESSQANMINGQNSYENQWIFVLSPKHAGSITIPSLAQGSEKTKAITIKVTANAASDNSASSKEHVFLTATITPLTPYIQGESLYTLKIYYDRPVANPQLQEPHAPNVTVFHVGQDQSYQQVLSGQRYQVMELHFAILPQTSGMINLMPAQFAGNMLIEQDGPHFYDKMWRPVQAKSNLLTLQVQPKPNAYKAHWWLPASQVSLQQNTDPSVTQVKAGDPITRTITMTALGTSADNLPSLTTGDLPGASAYADKPILSTQTAGQHVLAKRTERIVYIPTTSGSLTLPAIHVPWFNTQTQQIETANLPAQTIKVVSNPQIRSNTNIPSVMPVNVQKASIDSRQPSQPPLNHSSSSRWFWLAMIILGLWLITLLAFWYTRHKANLLGKHPAELPKRQLLAKAQGFAKTREAKSFAQILVFLASRCLPHSNIQQLADLKPYLDDKGQAVIDTLQQHLYDEKPKDWDGLAAWQILKPQLLKNRSRQHDHHHIPPAYPKD